MWVQAVFGAPGMRTYQGANTELKGFAIADKDAEPPSRMERIVRRDGAPVRITSSDGKYSLGATCD